MIETAVQLLLLLLVFSEAPAQNGSDRLCIIHSFNHSGHFYSAPSSPLLLRGAPDYSTDTVSEFHAEAHRQLQVKDLPKVLYVTARAGVEPTTLRLKVIDSTKAPSRPIIAFAVVSVF